MERREISKLLVANRGEIAVRIFRTCRELGIQTVAVYSTVDRNSPHVTLADEAYHIGPAPSRESYLRMDRILEVARVARVDAIHPGYGFLSENPIFADRVERGGFIFIGPPSEAIRTMGDKTEARRLALNNNIPTVPGTEGPALGIEDVDEFGSTHGFPILLKAAAGGGGKGMRIVRHKDELAGAFRAATSEAGSAFGDSRVYAEKYLESPRHVEFQILADNHGKVVHLGERECSIQRRHQKIIEESPCVAVDPVLRERMGETAVRIARACGYRNAGTIEFLLDKDRNFYFLEMNTRLQVEHPVTELRTGLDLVALQVRLAGGEELLLEQDDIEFRGHAIECRISAEDIRSGFLPSTGTLTHLRTPSGPGVREDRGVEQGGEVSVYYDPLIAKLIVWGQTREDSISRMTRALEEYEILGVSTNIPACLFVLRHHAFINGNIDTHFLEKYFGSDHQGKLSERDAKAIALAAALHSSMMSEENRPVSADTSRNGHRWKSLRKENMRSS